MSIQSLGSLALIRKGCTVFLEPVCKKYRLTQNELSILLFLDSVREPVRMSDICFYQGMSKGHVSISVTHLVRLGLIRKEQVPGNRKEVYLYPTAEAEPAVRDGVTAFRNFEQLLYSQIPPEQIENAASVFRAMAENVSVVVK